jgi:hypothetical protein
MNNKLKMTREVMIVEHFNVLSPNFGSGTEKNHKKPQARSILSRILVTREVINGFRIR